MKDFVVAARMADGEKRVYVVNAKDHQEACTTVKDNESGVKVALVRVK